MSALPETTDLPAHVGPGAVLAGKYRVERVIGKGGMGVVVVARHLHLDEPVAIKLLLPSVASVADTVARFDREARAAVKIKSEHIARVLDVGRLESGEPYVVMEYLDGLDLSAWLAQRGPLPFDLIAELVIQACDAIAEAHTLGIIHRDLKPSNLFCVRRPDGLLAVKVLDFGISKLTAGGQDFQATSTTAVFGSPLYMSPEQMKSARSVDARTDIWSLGIVLLELATGRPPFDADTMPALVIKVVSEPAPRLAALRSDAPPGFEAVVARCLEKDRDLRYATVAELAVALAPFAPPRAQACVDRIVRVSQAAQPGRSSLAASGGFDPQASYGGGLAAGTGSVGANVGGAVAAGTSGPWSQPSSVAEPSPAVRRGVIAAAAALGLLAIGVPVAVLASRRGAPVTQDASPRAGLVTADGPAAPSGSVPSRPAPPATGSAASSAAPDAFAVATGALPVAAPTARQGDTHPPPTQSHGASRPPSAGPVSPRPANPPKSVDYGHM